MLESLGRRITGVMRPREQAGSPPPPPSQTGPRYSMLTGRRLDRPRNTIRRRISNMLGMGPPDDPYKVGFEKEGMTAKEYKAQGDVGLYTVENVKARQSFRHDPEVVGWLTRFYETCVRERAPRGDLSWRA